MIKTAVILAAGLGSRLRERTASCPKGFLEIDNLPIVEHSITKLLETGIERIVIGTGYLSGVYEQLALRYPQIQCVRNERYEATGSMYTLYTLKEYMHEDFLLLESDLIYEKNALLALAGDERENVILASAFTNSGDEVFIEADARGRLLNMSKRRGDLGSACAELVGITKLSYAAFQKMCAYAKRAFQVYPRIDYEQALVGIAKDVDLYIHRCERLAWCEVDDETHWKRALEVVYPVIKAKESIPASVKRNILLNPGPATTTDTVKYAQVVPDICPREKEFGEVMEFIGEELTAFVADSKDYAAVLFGGSGTAAVEAILSSAIGEGTLLIINNGAYGKRMCQIAEVYGLDYIEYKSPIDAAINLKNLEACIQRSMGRISHLAIVHNETTTGLLNDIEAVGKLCQMYHIKMIVDAMSSFAAIPIDMKEMNISYLAASSNKNLQGMAGVSFVIARKEELERTKQIKPRNFYLHLYSQYEHFKKTKQMQFTPPVQTLYALKQAILEAKHEGISNRYERYCRAWETLIEGIARLGFKHLVSKNDHSKIITSILEPADENYDFEEMHDFFYERGFTIYPGKIENLPTFRVANIGDITYRDMERFIELLGQYMHSITSKNREVKKDGNSKT
ncbi:MAG: 2-aminoethylphosphonate aminotransferase [Ectobacillus sp.]